MSSFRRRLLIMMATNSGIPNNPIRFKDGKTAVFKNDRRGYFALDYSFVKTSRGGRMYFKNGNRIAVIKKK